MNTLTALLPIVAPLLLVALVVMAAICLPRRKTLVALANVGEGRWPGQKTYYTDAALSERYLLATNGSDDRHAAICGASDIPIGLFTDEADAAEEPVNVDLLGCAQETKLGVAAGAISEGDFIVPAASGGVRTLPVASGTYYIIGQALEDAADTENVHFIPSFPVQRVVA